MPQNNVSDFWENVLEQTDGGARLRKFVFPLANLLILIVLGSFSALALLWSKTANPNTGILVLFIFLKYALLLLLVYALAKRISGQFFNYFYELENDRAAVDFLGQIVFGPGRERVEVSGGNISNENSPLILVGGPGEITVGFDNVVLLEDAKGQSKVIYPDKKPFRVERFERIRKVSESEFAIINLQKHLLKGVAIQSRTKDGILITAEKIHFTYRLLSGSPPANEISPNHKFSFDPRAVESLIYNQLVITPKPSTLSSLKRLMDDAVISLVTSEIEQFIKSYILNELFDPSSQADVDRLASNESRIAELLTGKPMAGASGQKITPVLPPRMPISKIMDKMRSAEFIDKAAQIGVQIEKIEIGEWRLPLPVAEKLAEARSIFSENSRKHANLTYETREYVNREFIKIVNDAVGFDSKKLSAAPDAIALNEIENLVKNFRTELIAAREAIRNEDDSSAENKKDLDLIEKALTVINSQLSR